ncbi:MAG TPA: M23 family metallopeptidase, partial [Ignavibacteria bacterium]|nr:M23 family metallopeptidase [Ignavibacteria bacterium]
GTPIHSVGDGIITGKGFNKFNGNFIKIRHNNIYSTEYLHLSGFAKNIRKGKKVLQGQIIGYVGSTGLATGPHLDFRFFKNNYPINPLNVKSPPTKSVNNKLMDTFVEIKDRIITQLDSIHITNKVENLNKVSAG